MKNLGLSNYHRALFCLSAVIGSGAISAFQVRAQTEQECSGILHKDRDGLRFGGGKGEGEGICVINKSEEGKVLATCSPGRYCKVMGVMEDCKDSGECGELTQVKSVRRR
jgi:hypothetical protein